MSLYSCFKPLVFGLSPDRAHAATLKLLQAMPKWMCAAQAKSAVNDPFNCMGLEFKNRVGLAAGFDKNGVAINALFALGFGFVEVGGVTPQPQKGNPYPHVLRLPEQKSLINHCGLNNYGVDALLKQLKKPRLPGIVGVNLCANKTTALDKAYEDYALGLNKLYRYADYFSINISCPNVAGKDAKSQLANSENIVEHMCEQREQCKQRFGIEKPLLLKLSPDTSAQDLNCFLDAIKHFPVEGIICGNTSVSRPKALPQSADGFSGGLSGELLAPLAREGLNNVKQALPADKTIIACGGISSAKEAKARISAGADLVQVYTGMIFEGPELVKQIAEGIATA